MKQPQPPIAQSPVICSASRSSNNISSSKGIQVSQQCLLACLCCFLAILAAAALPSSEAMPQSRDSPASSSFPSAPFVGGFGQPGCPCRPHNPQHPQQAFCAGQFALKVKIRRSLGSWMSDDGTESGNIYRVQVKSVFRNTARRRSIQKGRSVHILLYGNSDVCGLGDIKQPNGSMITTRLRTRRSYLVTGNINSHGMPALSKCSWVAYWPTKRQRRLKDKTFEGNFVSNVQARYLRVGVYESSCQKCQIASYGELASRNGSEVCRYQLDKDPKACFPRYAHCARHYNPYARSDECEWHTANWSRYKKCQEENLMDEANWMGIKG